MTARARPLLLAASLVVLAGSACRISLPDDPMLDLDLFEGLTWNAAEIVPGAPWIRAGADRELGTNDDRILPRFRGDVDLVLRTGRTSLGATIPAPASGGAPASWPRGEAEPFGEGTPIAYVVVPVDAWHGPAPGTHAAPPYWNGLPLLVLAFADLDGDGVIGVTLLDGDATDAGLEEAERDPVGRHFAFGASGVASGSLQIGVGGPGARPARIALAAATWAGEFDPSFLGGHVPRGPAVMTRLPFLPEMGPERVLEGGLLGPPPATPDALVGVEVREAYAPDPADPRVGESFTLRLDGSDATIDAALIESGVPSRFGAVRAPDPASYVALPARPLRPGLDPGSIPRAVEVLARVLVADDGPAGRTVVRIVALDRLANVTEPAAATSVTLRASGPLRIAFPDQDGDTAVETVTVSDAVGVAVELDDTGGAFDGPDAGVLLVETADSITRIEALLPDADVDDSGSVDGDDIDAIHAGRGDRLGDASFDLHLDLDASGRIEALDEELAAALLGSTPAVP